MVLVVVVVVSISIVGVKSGVVWEEEDNSVEHLCLYDYNDAPLETGTLTLPLMWGYPQRMSI